MEASESLEQDATASSTQVRTRPRTLKPTVKRIRLEFTRVGNRKCDYTDLKTKTKTGLIRNLLMLETERKMMQIIFPIVFVNQFTRPATVTTAG